MESKGTDTLARLAVCVVVAVSVIYAVEKLCEGKNIPLWEKYGPWLKDNKLQAISIAAAVLYGASLALWPEALAEKPPEAEDYTPCP